MLEIDGAAWRDFAWSTRALRSACCVLNATDRKAYSVGRPDGCSPAGTAASAPARGQLLQASIYAALATPFAACRDNTATGRRQFLLASATILVQRTAQFCSEILAREPRSLDAGLQDRLDKIGDRITTTGCGGPRDPAGFVADPTS